ncbi:MAG: methyltransferase domain-containing protein, partial [Actinomycetota bacterium]
LAGRADAVFGSRMMIPNGAIKGGMPLYKYVGNKFLTAVQNSLAGIELSEWHSGYRAYSVPVLAQLPLEYTSDGFQFDTEIILQLHARGFRIEEIPITTHYGDEICYVNGFAYARDIVVQTARYRLGQRGFGSGALAQPEPYGFKSDPNSSHGRILAMVGNRRRAPKLRVLDIGCGPGWLAEALSKQGHDVTGVDIVGYGNVADRMMHFVRADIEDGIPPDVGSGFDLIIAADVLEHVRDSDRVLRSLVEILAPGGSMIICVPNVSHWYPRFRIALGLFGYDQRGILDRTHLRFFTMRTLAQMLRRANLSVRELQSVGLPFDALSVQPGKISPIRRVDDFLAKHWPNMFACQYVVEVTPS